MTTTAQVAVVGAGPAGGRAAELLAGLGTSVVLLDPKAPWEKPCGGGLTPAAFDEIPELAELRTKAREIGHVRIELSSGDGFSVKLRRPMHVVSRRVLGRWQLTRARAAGAVHLPARVRGIHRLGAGWLLSTDDGPVRASFLVGADGAASLVRRVVAPAFQLELAPTRVAYLPGPGPTPDHAVLRFFGGVAGYLWDFPRSEHRSVGMMVAPGSLRRAALDGEIDAYRYTVEPHDRPEPQRAGAVIGTAHLGHGDFCPLVGADFALLGDAAGLADPLTGEGIQNAMRSATLFAQSWREGNPWRYRDLLRHAFRAEFALMRFLRRSLLESGLGVGLVQRALASDTAYATVATLLNALNEHEPGPFSLSRGGWRALRRARDAPTAHDLGVRAPIHAPEARRRGARRPAERANREVSAG